MYLEHFLYQRILHYSQLLGPDVAKVHFFISFVTYFLSPEQIYVSACAMSPTEQSRAVFDHIYLSWVLRNLI